MPGGRWLATAVGAGASEARPLERVLPPTANAGRFGALSELLRNWWALGGCILLALVLRAPYLSMPLGRDEGGLAYMAQHWLDGHGSLYGPYWVDRPPLLFLLFKARGARRHQAGVRALGALSAVALVIGIALLARAVEGPRAGWIAGLLAALSQLRLDRLDLHARRDPRGRAVDLLGPVPRARAPLAPDQLRVRCGPAGGRSRADQAVLPRRRLRRRRLHRRLRRPGSGRAPALAARLRRGRGHSARRAARLAGGGASDDRRPSSTPCSASGSSSCIRSPVRTSRCTSVSRTSRSPSGTRAWCCRARGRRWGASGHLRKDRVLLVTFSAWLAAATSACSAAGATSRTT